MHERLPVQTLLIEEGESLIETVREEEGGVGVRPRLGVVGSSRVVWGRSVKMKAGRVARCENKGREGWGCKVEGVTEGAYEVGRCSEGAARCENEGREGWGGKAEGVTEGAYEVGRCLDGVARRENEGRVGWGGQAEVVTEGACEVGRSSEGSPYLGRRGVGVKERACEVGGSGEGLRGGEEWGPWRGTARWGGLQCGKALPRV